MRQVEFTFTVPDTAYFCALQTVASGAGMLFNGTGAVQNQFYPTAYITMPGGFERTFSLTSAADLSLINFVFVWLDQYGTQYTETIAGPNANTVYTVGINGYKLISVTPASTVASTVSIGTGTTGNSCWFIPNRYAYGIDVGIQITVIAGTLIYTIQNTDYEIMKYGIAPTPSSRIISSTDTNVVAATTSQITNYIAGIDGIRLNLSAGDTNSNLIVSFASGSL